MNSLSPSRKGEQTGTEEGFDEAIMSQVDFDPEIPAKIKKQLRKVRALMMSV